jgi:hypothetical protein
MIGTKTGLWRRRRQCLRRVLPKLVYDYEKDYIPTSGLRATGSPRSLTHF